MSSHTERNGKQEEERSSQKWSGSAYAGDIHPEMINLKPKNVLELLWIIFKEAWPITSNISRWEDNS